MPAAAAASRAAKRSVLHMLLLLLLPVLLLPGSMCWCCASCCCSSNAVLPAHAGVLLLPPRPPLLPLSLTLVRKPVLVDPCSPAAAVWYCKSTLYSRKPAVGMLPLLLLQQPLLLLLLVPLWLLALSLLHMPSGTSSGSGLLTNWKLSAPVR